MPVNFTTIDDKESNLKNADFSKEEWKRYHFPQIICIKRAGWKIVQK